MKSLKLVNPATGKQIKKLKIFTEKKICAKVRLAGKVQESWAGLPYRKRAYFLKKFNSLVKKEKKDITELISLEMGKPLNEAMAEVERATENTEWFIKNTGKELAPKKLGKNVMLLKEPAGVVGAITPWNLPFMIPLWIIPPALLTGNTIVFKPSELTPLTGIKISKLFDKAGLPKGCLNLLIGAENEGKRLVESDINIVAFVGSRKAGKNIMKNSAEKLHRLVLEMGGKDPLIVCSDADLKKAAKDAVKGALSNCGQLCASVERIYVEKKVYNSFVREVLSEAKKWNALGPLSNKNQLKIVEFHLKDAEKKGARILFGGKKIKGKGYYFEPTVIANVNHSMKIMNQETFGPVIAVMKVNGIKQAIKFSNSLSYGLCASVYSKNKSKTRKMASQLQAGTICINCTPKSRAEFPWGGRKQSGLGRMLSTQGINEYLETKVIND
ncbi:aldehyde dehydrogenase family protein [Candidatus Micrarchaeota archaeon]|nr:aldehyde dehydrogenase family protein [Candidatus Micrarchaeota archaeon]